MTQTHSASAPEGLIDRYGRRVTYLRLSVTDRCDFRCHYCMAETMTFLPRSEVMSLEECLRVVTVFRDFGARKIRITGGEPLVRHDLPWLLERIAALPGIDEVVLTTNGSQLAKQATVLRDAGVKRLNISLDTLRPERFSAITRKGRLEQVLDGIEAARAAGFKRIKINTVLLKDENDDELEDLVRYVVARGMDIAFIESMALGEVGEDRRIHYLSCDQALERLQPTFNLVASAETTGGPARYWRVPDADTRVGFIAPHSHNFCESCNRVRVTARGELFPCLGNDASTPLMPILRDPALSDADLRQAIADGMGLKPKGHEFEAVPGEVRVMRFMSMTGG